MAKILHSAFSKNAIENVDFLPEIQWKIPPIIKGSVPLQPKSSSSQSLPLPKISDTHDFAQKHMPKGVQPGAAKAAIQEEPANTDEDNLRVLLVEDNPLNLRLLVAYMRKLRVPHSTACNGLEALNAYKAACRDVQFDVIFMDISMPIMSGLESTKHIRRFEREANVAPCMVIALTGAANPEARQEAFSSGIDLFLTKPVPMKELKVMLEEFKRGGRDALVG
jgi:CheY-like chemotaxis protein